MSRDRAAGATTEFRQRRRGLLIVGLGVLVLSVEGLVIRFLSVDQWTILQWRGILMFVVLGSSLTVGSRGDSRPRMLKIGASGLLAAVLFGLDNVLFVVSLMRTDVANTLLMISSAPAFAAVFSMVFLRERVPRKTMVMITVAMVAVALILTGGMGDSALAGNLAGLGAGMCLAGTFVVLRGGRSRNMLGSMAWGALLAAIAATPFAQPLSPQGKDLALLLLLGAVVSPSAFGLLGTGPRYLPAPEVSMVILAEAVLGPVWVWLAMGEVPVPRVIVGGTLLLGSLAVYYWTDITRARRVVMSVISTM